MVRYNNIVYVFIQHHSPGEWNESHVKEHDITIDIPGKKFGEEYVALRESNIPVHSHSETISNVAQTSGQDWAAKEKGGSTTRLVNTPQTPAQNPDARLSIGLKNTSQDYQISPLEYTPKGANQVTLPHDNLPPYLKVYIWECTELTEDERSVTAEPDDGLCVITWLANGGTWSVQPPVEPNTQKRTLWTRKKGQKIKYNPDSGETTPAPGVSLTGHYLHGWKCPDGTIKPSTSSNPNIPPVIDDVAIGNAFYVAQWKPNEYTVTFDAQGGVPGTMSRKYKYNQELGYLPTLDEMAPNATSLKGWYTTRTGNNQISPSRKVTGNVTYYAQWNMASVPKYTVKFYKDKDFETTELPEFRKEEVPAGSRLGTLSTNPYTKTGYTFNGWYTKTEGGTKVSETFVVNSNLNLYAHWDAGIYTITWNPNYTGAAIETWKRSYGVKLGTLPVALRTGFSQNGWWTATSGGTQATSNTTVAGNITYYAHWTRPNYTITYDLRGGSGTPGPTSYNVQTPTFSLVAPTKQGNTFLGWIGSNGTSPQTTVTIPIGSTGNKSYTAVWDAKTYVVKFLPNGGTGTMADQTFNYGEYQRLSKNTFSNNFVVEFKGNGGEPNISPDPEDGKYKKYGSYKFIGWSKTAAGAKQYGDEESVINLTESDSINLYAKWGDPEYMYLPGAGRSGYDFDAWYTSAAGGTRIGGNNYQWKTPYPTTLYAHWKAKKMTVTFDPTLGTVTTTSQEATYNQPYGPLPVPTSDEYTFRGWYTLAEGGTQVTASTIVTRTDDHTLYAQWEDGKINLTFDPNNGELPEGVPSSRRCWKGRAYGELPTPIRDGYLFCGWIDDLESDTPQEITSESIAPDHDVTIYATWLPIGYTVRYNANDAQASGSMADQIMTYGTPANLSPLGFSKSGSVFLGWAETPSGNPKYDDQELVRNLTTTSNEVVNLYAKWLSDPITVRFNSNWDQNIVTFDANGGTGGWARKMDTGATLTPPLVSRGEYVFTGWSPTPPSTVPVGGGTYVAQWLAPSIQADVTVNNKTATCSNVQPSGATVQYSTSSQSSGYTNGNQFTLSFSANTTQTKTGWFKISYPGVTDGIYKVSIKQTYRVTNSWSDWSAPTGPWNATQVAGWVITLRNRYGASNVETRGASNGHGIYVQERHVISTSSSTSYSSTVTRVQ